MPIHFQQAIERAKVMFNTAENLFFLQPVGHRHLNGAIEGKFAVSYSFQHFES